MANSTRVAGLGPSVDFKKLSKTGHAISEFTGHDIFEMTRHASEINRHDSVKYAFTGLKHLRRQRNPDGMK